MGIEVKRLGYGLGAEVRGVDPTRPLDAATVRAVRTAWLENQILLFPDMEMSVAQHVAFSRNFGEIETTPVRSKKSPYPDHPEIVEVRSQPRAGEPHSGKVDVDWHSDGAYTLCPPTGSFLHCRAMPDVGGNTCFTNMYMAYERLSAAMKRVVDNLKVVNSIANTSSYRNRMRLYPEQTMKDLETLPPVVQPMVRVHPETGRRALYLSEGMTGQIYGMTQEEGAGLLKYLFQHCVRDIFMYRHRWRINDVILWDNRCVMHMVPGDFDPAGQLRLMLRTTLVGEPCGEPYRPATQPGASVQSAAVAKPAMA